MPIATTCPNCKAIFRLGDDLAGKIVRCQKCSDTFTVPSADSDTSTPGIPTPSDEADEGSLAYAANPKPKKPVAKERDDDDDDDDHADEEHEQRRSSRRQPERDRPGRRYARERKSAKSGGGALVWVLAIAGLSFFLCIGCSGVGLFAYLVAEPGRAKKVAVNNVPPPAFPPGGINVVFGPDNRFRQANQLTMFDPVTPEGSRHKVYMLHGQANRTYQIDMTSNQIDCYLVVLDDVNMVVARDDDGGGGLNARIIFTPVRTAFFRIEAANCPPRINPKSPPTGPYLLTIDQR